MRAGFLHDLSGAELCRTLESSFDFVPKLYAHASPDCEFRNFIVRTLNSQIAQHPPHRPLPWPSTAPSLFRRAAGVPVDSLVSWVVSGGKSKLHRVFRQLVVAVSRSPPFFAFPPTSSGETRPHS